PADRHRDGVPHHAGAHHHQRLAHHGVHLPRHDGGARLERREPDLGQPARRARAHPADVVGDLHERDGDGVERAGRAHVGVLRPLRLEVVLGLTERDARHLRDVGDGLRREAGVPVDAGADGGAAEGELGQLGARGAHARGALAHLRRVAAELLPEADGRGVHEVRPPALEHVVERLRLRLQRPGEPVERRDQLRLHRDPRGDVHRRRDHVVRRLPHVDVVVGVDLPAGGLGGEAGDDLVRVHVRRGPAAGLVDVEGEVGVEGACADALGGGGDGLGDGGVEEAEVAVGAGAGGLDGAERLDEPARERLAGDGEVLLRALRLGAVEGVGGDADLAEGVGLDAVVGHLEERGNGGGWKIRSVEPRGYGGGADPSGFPVAIRGAGAIFDRPLSPPVFYALFFVQLGVALAASLAAAVLFDRATGAVFVRAFGEEVGRGWRWLVRFAVLVVGVSSGVRLYELERYAEEGRAPRLNGAEWLLEVYRAAVGALESVVWALLLFFLVILFIALLGRRAERPAERAPERSAA